MNKELRFKRLTESEERLYDLIKFFRAFCNETSIPHHDTNAEYERLRDLAERKIRDAYLALGDADYAIMQMQEITVTQGEEVCVR